MAAMRASSIGGNDHEIAQNRGPHFSKQYRQLTSMDSSQQLSAFVTPAQNQSFHA